MFEGPKNQYSKYCMSTGSFHNFLLSFCEEHLKESFCLLPNQLIMNPSCTPLQEVCFGENCSESQSWMYWRKSKTKEKEDPKKKLDAAFGTTFRLISVFKDQEETY